MLEINTYKDVTMKYERFVEKKAKKRGHGFTRSLCKKAKQKKARKLF